LNWKIITCSLPIYTKLFYSGGSGSGGPPTWVQELIAAKSGMPWGGETSTRGPIVVYSAAVIPPEPAPPTPFWNKWKYRAGSYGNNNETPKGGYKKKKPYYSKDNNN